MPQNLRIFALGGNEISPTASIDPQTGKPLVADIPMQWQKTASTCRLIADIISARPKDKFIITHGNGPQVGNVMLRSQYSRPILHPVPLDVCVANTQGSMSYMIAQLNNELKIRNIKRQVCGVITQVVVDPADAGFRNPAKFIGPSYSKKQALEYKEKDGWNVKLYKKTATGKELWRRVVPSPKPLDIVEIECVSALLDKNLIPVTVGGGGIPVIKINPLMLAGEEIYQCNYEILFRRKYNKKNKPANLYSGVEAVVDKDLASALLGIKLLKRAIEKGKKPNATLTIFTGEDGAKLNYQTPDEKPLRKLTADEAQKLLDSEDCPFPPGSMGPKIEAAINFVEGGGTACYITKPEFFEDTLKGNRGTVVVG